MMIRAVLFDMDGLMFDTENLSNQAWRHTGEIFGIPVTEQFLQSLKGRNRNDCTMLMKKEWGQEVDLTPLRREYQKYVQDYLEINGVPVKEGLFELLDYLKAHDISINLVTSTQRNRAEELLKGAGVFWYFDRLIFGDMVAHGKPEPDIYLKCIQETGCQASECLVLEDSPSGVKAGFLAGCHIIMVPDFVPPSDAERKMADRIVRSLKDVICYLEEKLLTGPRVLFCDTIKNKGAC